MGMVKGNVFLKLQPVQLTEAEVLKHGEELANANSDLAQAERDKKSVVSEFTSKIAGYETAIERHTKFIQTKQEWRDIECQWRFDFDAGTKQLVRLDTHEVLESEIKVTDNDRQKMLKIAPKQIQEGEKE